MEQPGDRLSGAVSPIAQALGEDIHRLHPAVRRHYLQPAMDASGVMDTVRVNPLVRPLAILSYALFGAPVPRGGRDVGFALRNRTDDAGTMHWIRRFSSNASFPKDVTFESQMVYLGDHSIKETTRHGLGIESRVRVGDGGSLVYEIVRYVVRVPLVGLAVGFPTWLSPFGGGRITETGEGEDCFAVDFQMAHSILGPTVGYSGRCRIS